MKFIVPIKPTGLQRARSCIRNGIVRVFDTEQNQALKEAIAWSARASGIREMYVGPVLVVISAYRELERLEITVEPVLDCAGYDTAVPDIDNISKLVLDGLNKVAYRDDRQVVALRVDKWR